MNWLGCMDSYFCHCCYFIVCILMSIIDNVCVAQGQALGLMHCPHFTDDKSL